MSERGDFGREINQGTKKEFDPTTLPFDYLWNIAVEGEEGLQVQNLRFKFIKETDEQRKPRCVEVYLYRVDFRLEEFTKHE